MASPFVRKLEYGAALTAQDCLTLESASHGSRKVAGRTTLISEGDEPRNVHLIKEGFACRYKLLPNGKRQIMAFFVPGDICDLHVHILGQMDHSIGTLIESDVVDLSPETIAALAANPRINRALWWSTLVDEGTLREWLVGMGQRPTDQQTAHLFCELLARLQAIGRAMDNSFDMPFTQEELADALGVTIVHANRTLMALRGHDLIRIEGRRLIVADPERLRQFCDFDANYLHLADRQHGLDRRVGGGISV
ncbi:CRP-like cAMP-binding protein [Sphingomonas zeicaulis]|uniref:Crp/Fnr family transcriptional regulator n=1 Tax=Sphingomonas zeicaulis TaxID=1632740 RepID=UPI003D1D1427